MEKRWVINKPGDEETVRTLMNSLGVDRVIANLLVQRGITSFEMAKAFFRPSLDDLHDPFLMKDMDKAVARLEVAMKKQERVMIYGDYDVDGTTSVALVYTYLRNRFDFIDYYIPDRYSEGYGVSKVGIDYAAQNNISLIIALDCGIKAVQKITYAKEKGIDFIVCDHHTPDEILPDAAAVLDPKKRGLFLPMRCFVGMWSRI